MTFERYLISVTLQFLYIDSVICRERRTGKIIKNISYVIGPESLPAGIDLYCIIDRKLINRLINFFLNSL